MRSLFLLIFLNMFHAPAFAACTDPDGVPGELMYNESYDVFQGCTGQGWAAFHAPDANPVPAGPQNCPDIGDVCTNGIIYAGEYTGHKLYVTGADAPGTFTWNDGSTDFLDLDNTFMPNCRPLDFPRYGDRYSDPSNPACTGAQGKAFTEYLANFTGSDSPYKAANYCYHLGKASDPSGPDNPLAHGRDDWYLPAVDELEFIYDNLGPSPNHGFQSAQYWASTEFVNYAVWFQDFTGYQDIRFKLQSLRVRCVAR